MDKSKGKIHIPKRPRDEWLVRRAIMTAVRELGLSWRAIGYIFNMESTNARRMILNHKQRENIDV